LLPGFALIDRTKDLELHFKELESSNTETELLDAWLDFLSLKAIAVKSSDANGNENDATWVFVPKPADGWIVPLQVGYKGISKLYEPGQIENARDLLFPFRFVEAIYSVGSWVAPYRLNKIEELLWQYEVKNDWYLCRNVCDNA
jgi:CRISPR-associated protein Csy2